MARPSEPLLGWLREMLKTKGLNTAHVADASGISRSRVRRILSGTDDMTVDELMMLSDALQLDPADLTSHQLPTGPAPLGEAGVQPLAEAADTSGEPAGPVVDPWGNQPRQLFEIAFALGCDFFFLVDTRELDGSGVPASVLEKYAGRELPIKLDAAYHQYNDPRYSPTGITLTLSFDALYECTFHWSCIRQFVLFPLAPDPTQDVDPPSEDDGPPTGVPHLRLVT